ncbi:hypothetical protein MFIFM68171_02193 [Madurella fahalii]|uniref:Uncharacterized protein n=1 Tax=Madurella fahalii TaxID=1157608 RepID=A0ABQ0G2J4_9PEZI
MLALPQKWGKPHGLKDRDDLLHSLPLIMSALAGLHSDRTTPLPPHSRWHRARLPDHQYPSLGFTAQGVEKHYQTQATRAAREMFKSVPNAPVSLHGEGDGGGLQTSADCKVVLDWVLERMHLVGVPAHYLVTDPSHLEAESIKFFHVDPNWVDAMVDGALGLGNHMGSDKDCVAILMAINDVLARKKDEGPRVPVYGFYLRSKLVDMFPGLRETLPASTTSAPLLRHGIVGEGVLMALFDRTPGM